MDQNNQPFNLTDIAEVLNRRRKFIATFVFLAVAITALLVFFVLPKQYKSTAVIVAANPVLADKARLFNENIEGLYSVYGSEDDLNRLYGIATLDTTYKLLVQQFDLVKYYKIKGEDAALNQRKAITALKEDIEFIKTELYLLKISATTKDKNLSASIANAVVDIVQNMAQDVWKTSGQKIIDHVELSTEELENQFNALKDSSGNELFELKKQGLMQQFQKNAKILIEYKVALANSSNALIVLEKAYPSAKADKPKKLLTILAAFFASLTFSIVAVLMFERRR